MSGFDFVKLVDTGKARTVDVEWEDHADFLVTIRYLSKAKMQAMFRRHTKMVYSKRGSAREPRLNNEGLYREFADTVITNWKGLTVSALKRMVPVDAKIQADGAITEDSQVPYSHEMAVVLLKHAYGFEDFCFDRCTDIDLFTGGASVDEDELKNSQTSQSGT